MAKTFEQSIAELEEIVEQLENGDVTLDESLGLFEKGIKLSKSCQKMLDTAEKKVSILMTNDDGEIVNLQTVILISTLPKKTIRRILYTRQCDTVFLRAVKDFVRYL